MNTPSPNSQSVVNDPIVFGLPKFPSNLSEPARLVLELGALSSQLVAVTRTRVVHPDGRAENDAEHSFMLARIAPELAHLLYPDLDENLVARFALVHDDIEAYVGDTPTDMLAGLNQTDKDTLEHAGLECLRKEFAHIPTYLQLVNQYEAQSVPEARFVRAVDKLMVIAIHFPNAGAVITDHYTKAQFLHSEATILERDAYKYGEFEQIKVLRQELANTLAELYL